MVALFHNAWYGIPTRLAYFRASMRLIKPQGIFYLCPALDYSNKAKQNNDTIASPAPCLPHLVHYVFQSRGVSQSVNRNKHFYQMIRLTIFVSTALVVAASLQSTYYTLYERKHGILNRNFLQGFLDIKTSRKVTRHIKLL